MIGVYEAHKPRVNFGGFVIVKCAGDCWGLLEREGFMPEDSIRSRTMG